MSDQATLSPAIVYMGAVQPGARATVRINKLPGVGTLLLTGATLPPGVTIHNLAFPTVFNGAGYDFDLRIDPSAPARIDGEIVIYVNHGESIIAGKMHAVRAAVLPPAVNWATRVDYSYEFKTNEVVSKSGKSQRQALRRTPRRSMSYQMTLSGDGRAQFRNAIAGQQHKTFVVGDVPLAMRSPNGMGAGATSIVVENTQDWPEEGIDVLVVDKDFAEYRYLADVATEAEGFVRLTFHTSTTTIFAPGCKVFPGRLAMFPPSQQDQSLSAGVAQIQVVLNVLPGSQPYVEPSPPPVTHEDTEVLVLRPNWSTAASLTHEHDYDTLDYGQGLAEFASPITFGRRITRHSFALRTADDVLYLLGVFYRARGRRGIFYYPTFESDFEVLSDLAITTRSLLTSSGSAAMYLGHDTVFKAAAVILRDGSIICNRISSIETFGTDGSRVVFEDEWPRTISVAEIDRVSWLLVSSFASDGLTISWLTDQSAVAEVSFMTRENEL